MFKDNPDENINYLLKNHGQILSSCQLNLYDAILGILDVLPISRGISLEEFLEEENAEDVLEIMYNKKIVEIIDAFSGKKRTENEKKDWMHFEEAKKRYLGNNEKYVLKDNNYFGGGFDLVTDNEKVHATLLISGNTGLTYNITNDKLLIPREAPKLVINYKGRENVINAEGKTLLINFDGINNQINLKGKSLILNFKGLTNAIRAEGKTLLVNYGGSGNLFSLTGDISTIINYDGISNEYRVEGKNATIINLGGTSNNFSGKRDEIFTFREIYGFEEFIEKSDDLITKNVLGNIRGFGLENVDADAVRYAVHHKKLDLKEIFYAQRDYENANGKRIFN